MSDTTVRPKIEKSDAEWREQLTPDQYYVARKHGTERAFTSPLNDEKRDGIFKCIGCGKAMFKSDDKFDSGTGWPSYTRPADQDAVTEHEDRSLFMRRVEVRCATCETHLGHVFPDGPNPTGLRYCINGIVLDFDEGAEK